MKGLGFSERERRERATIDFGEDQSEELVRMNRREGYHIEAPAGVDTFVGPLPEYTTHDWSSRFDSPRHIYAMAVLGHRNRIYRSIEQGYQSIIETILEMYGHQFQPL